MKDKPNDKATLSDAVRASLLTAKATLVGSLLFYILVFIAWATGIAGDTKETITFAVFFAGFFITYGLLVGFIETLWPSREIVQFGRFGPMPQKAAVLFLVLIGVYFYLAGLIMSFFE